MKTTLIYFIVMFASLLPLKLNTYTFLLQKPLSLKISQYSPVLSIFEDETVPIESFYYDEVAAETLETLNRVELKGMILRKKSPNMKILLSQKPRRIGEVLKGKKFKSYSYKKARTPQEQFAAIEKAYFQEALYAQVDSKYHRRLAGLDLYNDINPTERAETFPEKAGRLVATASKEKKYYYPVEKKGNHTTVRIPRKGRGARITQASPPPLIETPKTVGPAFNPTGFAGETPAPTQEVYKGTFELSNGLAALGSGEYFRLYREIAGDILETGQVFVDKGRFEILVNLPKQGSLIAELVDEEDRILGRGEVLLAGTKPTKPMRIKIKPTSLTAQVRVISNYSYIKPDPVKGVDISVDGYMDMGETGKKGQLGITLADQSSVILRAKKEGYWGSLMFKSSDEKFEQKLFSNRTINTLLDYMELNKNESRQNGMVWGEVKFGDKAISGAEVELISDQGVRPVYFIANVVPDKRLKSTTSNGRFAFINVEPGVYLLRAHYNGRNISTQLVTVEAGYVSNVAVKSETKALSEIYVFDLATNKMEPSELNFLGSEKIAKSQSGAHKVKFNGRKGTSILEARSAFDEHFISRMTVQKSSKQIMVPLVSYEWMQNSLFKQKVNLLPESSIFLGLVKKEGVKVNMDPLGYKEGTEILYFDKEGNIDRHLQQAPKNGGFVVVNMSPGMRTFFLNQKETGLTRIHTALADPGVVNVYNPSH